MASKEHSLIPAFQRFAYFWNDCVLTFAVKAPVNVLERLTRVELKCETQQGNEMQSLLVDKDWNLRLNLWNESTRFTKIIVFTISFLLALAALLMMWFVYPYTIAPVAGLLVSEVQLFVSRCLASLLLAAIVFFAVFYVAVFKFQSPKPLASQVTTAKPSTKTNGLLLSVTHPTGTSKLEFANSRSKSNTPSLLGDEKKTPPGGSAILNPAVGTQTDNVTITSKDWASVQLDEASKSKPDGHPEVPNGQKPMEQQVPATPKPESSTVEASATTPSVKMDPVRSDEMASVPTRNSETAGIKIKLAEVQGELAVVNSKIEAERKRWQDANAAINALTNNKTRPVVRNSPEHVQMYEAQVIMKQVEAGAASLKEEKSRLEAMIKSLQESAP